VYIYIYVYIYKYIHIYIYIYMHICIYLYMYIWLMIAFITWNSDLVPLLDSEGLCGSNPCRFEFSGFQVVAGIESTTWGLTLPRSDQLSQFYIVSDRYVCACDAWRVVQVYVYVNWFVYLYIYIRTYLYESMYVQVYVYVNSFVYGYIYVHIYMNTYISACGASRVVQVHTYIIVFTYTYICLCVHIHIYTYVYILVCMHLRCLACSTVRWYKNVFHIDVCICASCVS